MWSLASFYKTRDVYDLIPGVEVLLQLVYSNTSTVSDRDRYEEKLKSTTVVYEWIPADDVDCVLKSQLARMFAFGHPLVKPTDVVATVDVNMLIATDKFLDPIYTKPDMLAWIFQYKISENQTGGQGENFPQVGFPRDQSSIL